MAETSETNPVPRTPLGAAWIRLRREQKNRANAILRHENFMTRLDKKRAQMNAARRAYERAQATEAHEMYRFENSHYRVVLAADAVVNLGAEVPDDVYDPLSNLD